jgi:hypothetical protein
MDDGLAPVFGSAVTSNVANDFAIVMRGALTPPDTFTITDVGSGIYRVSTTGTTGTNASNSGVVRFATNSGRGFRVTGYTLELGSTATNYQRVTTQYDVTEAGVASLGYLFFDGSGDFMVSSTITPGTDKVQVFTGVRKLVNASQCISELSADNNANTGSMALFTTAGGYQATSRGTSGASSSAVSVSALAPTSSVLTVTHDISGDLTSIRLNGGTAVNSTADQGTGNFLAYPLYIGRRGGISLPLNGLVFGLITRFGANLDAPTIASTEAYVADKTGITL